MKLFLLKRRDVMRPQYDCFNGFVIRAETAEAAREMAAGQAGDEGRDVWLSDTGSTCDEIPEYGGAGVLLSDFNAG